MLPKTMYSQLLIICFFIVIAANFLSIENKMVNFKKLRVNFLVLNLLLKLF